MSGQSAIGNSKRIFFFISLVLILVLATYYSIDGLLVKHGLFDDAIILCLAFKPIGISPLVNIFNGLVDRLEEYEIS